jgi:hypothetical protein
MVASLFLGIISGFNIFCGVINGLIGYQTDWTIFGVFSVLVVVTVVSRILHLAEEFMALGVLGAVLYIIFQVWAMATAPSGTNIVQS